MVDKNTKVYQKVAGHPKFWGHVCYHHNRDKKQHWFMVMHPGWSLSGSPSVFREQWCPSLSPCSGNQTQHHQGYPGATASPCVTGLVRLEADGVSPQARPRELQKEFHHCQIIWLWIVGAVILTVLEVKEIQGFSVMQTSAGN